MASHEPGSASHNSGTARTLFPKAESFKLDDFSNKDFIVKDFVEEQAEKAIPINRRSGPAQQAFDPKPLIRYFESMHRFYALLRTLLIA
jgi:hypothetical protein